MRAAYGGAKSEHWRPSIYMPRWASRITLEVTEVRVERLQDISEEDAQAEGVERCDGFPLSLGYPAGEDDGKCVLYPSAVRAFSVLWDSLNHERAPWRSNPWVWVIRFKRVQ